MSNPILVKKMPHFGLWVYHKFNMQNLLLLMNKFDSNILFRVEKFEQNVVFGKKVPHSIFREEKSDRVTKLKNMIVLDEDRNLVCQASRFQELVLEALDSDSKATRHYKVLSYLLEHCPESLAVETPVWRFLSPKCITGHIDLIVYQHPFLWLLDYKPKTVDTDAFNQVNSYRNLYCNLTGIQREFVKIGWFDRVHEIVEKI